MPMPNLQPCAISDHRTHTPQTGLRQRLFCYGTLQLTAVLESVIGRRLRGLRAALTEYGAFQVRNAEYPGLLHLPGQITWGLLYENLSPPELDVLDRFEGHLYRRRHQIIRRIDGRRVQAWVYMLATGRHRQLTAVPWQLERFRRSSYGRFMQRFVRDRRFLYA
jgi:gamma-glutamylcyclotransferase (GGCT)/AIG2-like uncharacterized protein YtfP